MSASASSATRCARPATSSWCGRCRSAARLLRRPTRSSSSAARCIPIRRSAIRGCEASCGSWRARSSASCRSSASASARSCSLGQRARRCTRARESEVGWFQVELTEAARDDPVLGSLQPQFDAFQWHHYTYELPAGAVELARSRVSTQAFRLERSYGIQFHAEVTGAQVERWLDEDPDDVADSEALRRETAARISAWNETGRALCRAFLETV